MSILSAIIKARPNLSPMWGRVSRDFAKIVKRGLAKEPEDRYQMAKDLSHDLAR